MENGIGEGFPSLGVIWTADVPKNLYVTTLVHQGPMALRYAALAATPDVSTITRGIASALIGFTTGLR